MLDAKPSLISINPMFLSSHMRPEVKLDVTYFDDKGPQFLVTNISNFNAYQIHLFAKEYHADEVHLALVAHSDIILEPREKIELTSYVQHPFSGCMSDKEYWVEFSNGDNKHFRHTQGFNNSGIGQISLKSIFRRTKMIGTEKRPYNLVEKTQINIRMFLITFPMKMRSIKQKLRRKDN